jgi:hypothetical protein
MLRALPAAAGLVALAIAWAPVPAASRPEVTTTGDLLRICETDTIDCLDIFSARLFLYAILHIDEMRRQRVFRDVVERYRDTEVFDGVCLPRARLTADRDFPDELSATFVRWARRHPEAHDLKPALGVRQAWREVWPCR